MTLRAKEQFCFLHLVLRPQSWANALHIWTKAADVHIWTCYGLVRDNQCWWKFWLGDYRGFKLKICFLYSKSFDSFNAVRWAMGAKWRWREKCVFQIWASDTNAILEWLLCLKIQTKKPPEMRSGCKWVFNCGRFLRKRMNCLLIFDGPTYTAGQWDGRIRKSWW